MTVRGILQAALTLMFESESSAGDYTERAAIILNVMLPETFGVNNQLRVFKGLPTLAKCPEVAALEDVVPFEEELCRAALPYGLAANLLMGDEEEARAGNYFSLYADAVNCETRLTPKKIRDVY